MPSPEEVSQLQELLLAHRLTLGHYLQQQAQLGNAQTPPGVMHGVREARQHIQHIKSTLLNWGVLVEDYPYDEALPDPLASLIDRKSPREGTDEVYHPMGTEPNRGPLTRCSFHINPHYRSKKRWEIYADVLVEFPNQYGTRDVYLIPSARATPIARRPEILNQYRGILEKKREATLLFVNKWLTQEISGYWYVMQTNTGKKVTVYSYAYDSFLNEFLSRNAISFE